MDFGRRYFTWKSFFYLFFVVCATASFFHHSTICSPFLGGDSGVHLLMTVDFDYSKDFYYWRQDRLGSYIPFVSSILYRLIDGHHLWIVSLVNYLTLSLGCIALTTFLPNTISKCIFSLLWFFPPHAFLNLLQIGMPQGISISFFAFGLYFINRPSPVVNAIAFPFFFISIWVSDLAAFSLLIYFALRALQNYKAFGLKKTLQGSWPSTIAISAIALAIVSLKRNAVTDVGYNSTILGSPVEIIQSFSIVAKNILATATDLESPDFILLILVMVVMMYLVTKHNGNFQRPIVLFFLINGLILLSICMLSHWVYFHNVHSRYFAESYVSLTFIACYVLAGKVKPLLIAFGLASMVSSIQYHYDEGKLDSAVSNLQEFGSLGKCGLIGSYWNAYEIAALWPKNIDGIPHDEALVRNYKYVDIVFENKVIYLNRNNWMDNFPDTITQFGYQLKKTSEPFNIKWYQLCQYEKF